jgi:TPR repeat protein
MKTLCFTTLLLFFIPFSAFSQPTAEDIHRLGIITVPQVIEVYNKAVQGDAYSQADIGQSLINGSIGILPNYQKALYWFKKAAKQGEPLAYFNLAMLYRSGNGVKVVKQSDKKAKEYTELGLKAYNKKVAKKEYNKYQLAEVQYQVANLYFWGIPGVVKQDLPTAFKIYYQSANSGFVHSIKQIAKMYYYGIGTKRDLQQAYQWTLLLATAGSVADQYTTGIDNLEGIGTDKNFQQGVIWIRRAATSYYIPAVAKLYQLNQQGLIKLTPAEEKTFKSILKSVGDNIVDIMSKTPQVRF